MENLTTPGTTFASNPVRRRGAWLFVVGGLGYVLSVFAMDRLRVSGHAFHLVLLPAAAAFVVAAVGLVEWISGTPCYRLRRRWPALRGWQRWTIGAFLAVTVVVTTVCLAVFLIMLLA